MKQLKNVIPVNSTESNKQIVLQAYASLKADNVEGYFNAMADDITLTYFGNHLFTGTYHGKKDILDNYVPVLLNRLAGPIRITVTNVIAEGDQVFVEAEGESKTQDGLDYNNKYGIILRLKDGKITQVREYMDTELVKTIFG
ncbi:nuclear transport factor 2 family protein [Chitinophaga lutea]|uniref:Nuclear transport factor 2 family protein n=1 Tax=Chitinophaga lutea TaxID=2488634 RepID=A0A3N4PAS9_9BACT|nr:nuclear transport factor 2 family protein [Chitinophaga lutea]RPE05356.1 nuclear transport factor 2 family protein [Chitinophaga lutea]